MKTSILMTLLSTLVSSTLSFQVRNKFNPAFFPLHCSPKLISSTRLQLSDENDSMQRTSVTGIIYQEEMKSVHPTVQLYTKDGCTLCDKAKDVLQVIRDEQPHSLESIDITDPDKTEYYDKYKWDIPVLHINGLYWTKHRLTSDEALEALSEARDGHFVAQKGQPNAAAMDKKMAERKANSL